MCWILIGIPLLKGVQKRENFLEPTVTVDQSVEISRFQTAEAARGEPGIPHGMALDRIVEPSFGAMSQNQRSLFERDPFLEPLSY